MSILLKRSFHSIFLVSLMLLLVSISGAQPEVSESTYRTGFISGNFKVFTSYLITSNKPKSKEFSGCHNLVIGYPEGWELLGVQSFSKEAFCYDLTFRLKDGIYKLCRLDLRSFRDAARSDMTIELHFKDDVGDITFVPASKVR